MGRSPSLAPLCAWMLTFLSASCAPDTAGTGAAPGAVGALASAPLMKLTPSVATDNRFGAKVSISGTTALVGVDNGVAGGAEGVYVFTLAGGTWTERQRLTATDGSTSFGSSVSIAGDEAIVGALGADGGNGAAYVFVRSGDTWAAQQKLTAMDGVAGDQFGWDVAISGTTALIGARQQSGWFGAAYVFTETGGTWSQQQKLTAPDEADRVILFGSSVDLSGATALVGAPYPTNDAVPGGSAYVFVQSGATWTFQQKLTPRESHAYDLVGSNARLSGTTALVGAFVFERAGTTWTELPKLTVREASENGGLGISDAISGSALLVGSSETGTFNNEGAAYVFTRTGATWTELTRLAASDPQEGMQFGSAVGLSGATVLVSANQADTGRGAAYVSVVPGIDASVPDVDTPDAGVAGSADGAADTTPADTTSADTTPADAAAADAKGTSVHGIEAGVGGGGASGGSGAGGAGTSAAPLKSAGCGCALATSDAPASDLVLVGLVGAAVLGRRRRRARRV